MTVGSWYAGGTTARAFNATIRSRVAAAAARLPNATTLLWWTPQAGPAPGGCTDKGGARKYYFNRAPLLRSMAQSTREAVALTAAGRTRGRGYVILGDAFAASQGVIQFSQDGAHIAVAPYQSLLVDELLSLLCTDAASAVA